MYSLINNCCETNFHLLRMVLRSFAGHNTTTLLNFFHVSTALRIENATQQNSYLKAHLTTY